MGLHGCLIVRRIWNQDTSLRTSVGELSALPDRRVCADGPAAVISRCGRPDLPVLCRTTAQACAHGADLVGVNSHPRHGCQLQTGPSRSAKWRFEEPRLVQRRVSTSGSGDLEGSAVVGPAVGHGSAVVDDCEVSDLVREVLAGGELSSAQELAGQDGEEQFGLVEPALLIAPWLTYTAVWCLVGLVVVSCRAVARCRRAARRFAVTTNKLVSADKQRVVAQVECRKCSALYGIPFTMWLFMHFVYWNCPQCGATITLNPLSCAYAAESGCPGRYVTDQCEGTARNTPAPAEAVKAHEADVRAWMRSSPSAGSGGASDSFKDDMADWRSEEPAALRQYYRCDTCLRYLDRVGRCGADILSCNRCHRFPPLDGLPGPDQLPLTEMPLSARRPVGFREP
jgi:hypothetical protein